MRAEVFHDRDSEYACNLRLFVDGTEVQFAEYSTDPAAGYTWRDWIESRAYDIASASPAVAAIIHQTVLVDSPYLDGRPADMTQCERELAEAIERARNR